MHFEQRESFFLQKHFSFTHTFRYKKLSKYSVVSLFSGCGGMDLGFLGGFNFLEKRYAKNRFEIIWANELSSKACDTYRYNISPNIIEGDVWENLESLPENADLVIGGFPCQDISINGKKAGVSGERSGLYRAMVETVRRVQPKVFIAENVKGLLMKYNQDSLQKVIKDFENLGYNVNYSLYNSANFGVPQTRERVFIVGTLKELPEYQHSPSLFDAKKWVTSQAAVHDLEHLEENREINHIWSKAKRSPEQGSRQLKSDRPSTTIRAECHGNIQFHYALDRRVSMREAARFQSFPDSFIFKSNLRETERQIGNAVPPVMAWQIARKILKYLDKECPDEKVHSSSVAQ